jgi:hypothetical protein
MQNVVETSQESSDQAWFVDNHVMVGILVSLSFTFATAVAPTAAALAMARLVVDAQGREDQ